MNITKVTFDKVCNLHGNTFVQDEIVVMVDMSDGNRYFKYIHLPAILCWIIGRFI